MRQHDAFLRAILETPEDDSPRLIYADWLEEHGDSDRAEFIRVQCRLAPLDEDDPDRLPLLRREYELLADHRGEWAGPLVGRVRRWQFRRGFVAQVKASVGQFLKEAKGLFDLAPIEEVDIQHPEPAEVRALAASRHLRRITRLNLDHAELGDAGARVLAESPNLSRLQHLSLRFNNLGRAGLLALARSPHLSGLRSLELGGLGQDKPDAKVVEAFVTKCRLPSLERLEWRQELGRAGALALASAPVGEQLTALHLKDAELGDDGLRLLAESSTLTRIRELSIEIDKGITSTGVAHLADSPLFGRLESLTLSIVGLRDEAVRALVRAPRPAGLRRLDLSFNGIGPRGARALAEALLCEALTRLDLSENPIGNEGVKAVATSQHLVNLHRLYLDRCGVTRAGANALLASPHLDRLLQLRSEENKIGPRAFDDLRARLGDCFDHELCDKGLTPAEVVRRVKEQPPRCLRGIAARTDTDLLRRFPRDRLDQREYPSVAFELAHPDPKQKAVLLGYEDTRGSDVFSSPYAIRWEPSGEQREFFDAEQHGSSGEHDGNCTIVGTGKRQPWRCGEPGCRDHTFLVTFFYRLAYPPRARPDPHLPFADQFYHIDLDAYCATQDRVIEIASFECN